MDAVSCPTFNPKPDINTMQYYGRVYSNAYGGYLSYTDTFRALVRKFISQSDKTKFDIVMRGTVYTTDYSDMDHIDESVANCAYHRMARNQEFVTYLDSLFKSKTKTRSRGHEPESDDLEYDYDSIGLYFVEMPYAEYISFEDYDGKQTPSIDFRSYQIDQVKAILADSSIVDPTEKLDRIQDMITRPWPTDYDTKPDI